MYTEESKPDAVDFPKLMEFNDGANRAVCLMSHENNGGSYSGVCLKHNTTREYIGKYRNDWSDNPSCKWVDYTGIISLSNNPM